MPRTSTEKAILQQRRHKDGILVPLLHELFVQAPPRIENKEDARWLHQLAMKMVERDQERSLRELEGRTVFGPSSLGECLRQVYLKRHWKRLGMHRLKLPAIEPAGYFLEGDFKHLKWQFALYKLSHYFEDFWLIDVEMPVYSKRGDHGGTIDVLFTWEDVPYVVDIKGLNTRSFQQIVRGEIPHNYRIQLIDYIMLKNNERKRTIPPIEKGILLVENKGGPDMYHPLALHEHVFDYKEHLPEVQARLGVLRDHEAKEETPPPECTSTKGFQFQGCPFRDFCKDEIKKIEKRRGKSASRNAKRLRVAKPARPDRAGRSGTRRGKGDS